MIALAVFLAIVGVYAFTLTVANIIAMRSYAPKEDEITTEGPMISVLIPARDEETSLPATLEALMIQDYKNYEVIVCDDNSTDGTWEVISRYMQLDKRIHGIQGTELPDGWRGKVHAMQQLYEAAQGEYILITDADIHHAPNSLSYGYSALLKNKVDMISGYAKETMKSMWTQVLISASLFITVFYVLLPLQRKHPKPFFAMAIGQYLFLKKAILDTLDGFSSMKHIVTDDIELAKLVVRNGYSQQFLDLNPILRVNMYSHFRDAFNGISRSVFHLTGKASPFLILLIVIALFALGLSLPISLIIGIVPAISGSIGVFHLLAFLGALMLYVAWIISALFHNYRLSTAMLGPCVFILVGWAYLNGLYIHMSKRGMQWRGRQL